jgi:hypothetical protein
MVTQAANEGRLSRGEKGEPPVNLFYLDVPMVAEVK